MDKAWSRGSSTMPKTTTNERWAIGTASLVLFCLSIYTLATIHECSFSRPDDGWQHRFGLGVFMFFLSETCVAFAVFCGICFSWACFAPESLHRLMIFLAAHVWHALLFFFLGSAVLGTTVLLATWLARG
jgi:hypothetical protein